MISTLHSGYSFNKYMYSVGLYSNQNEPLAHTGPNEVLSRISKEDLLDVPEATVVDLSDGSQIRMYEVAPSGDYDEFHTIVRVMDFANGIAPHSYASALAVAELLGHRVIVLPWNDIGLSRDERKLVSTGDFTPVSAKQSEALDRVIDGDSSLNIYGYSLGAQAALGLSKAINTGGVLQNDRLVLAEPPNTTRRNKLELLNDFRAAGPEDWADATRDSNWDALIDVVGVRTTNNSDYMDKDLRRFMRNMARLSNIAVLNAMQHPTFAQDLRNASLYMPAGSRVVLAKEQHSAMVPGHGLEDAFDYVSPQFQRLGQGIVALRMSPSTPEFSLGHAVGNNPFIAASLIERSVR